MPQVGKERPRCRADIINQGLRPYRTEAGTWDGLTAVDAKGNKTLLSTGMTKQMRKMVVERYWPAPEAHPLWEPPKPLGRPPEGDAWNDERDGMPDGPLLWCRNCGNGVHFMLATLDAAKAAHEATCSPPHRGWRDSP